MFILDMKQKMLLEGRWALNCNVSWIFPKPRFVCLAVQKQIEVLMSFLLINGHIKKKFLIYHGTCILRPPIELEK